MYIYDKKGKECFCDLEQLPQMLEKGFTQDKPKQKEKVPTSTGSKNPNSKAK